MSELAVHPPVLVMGVSGSGKSTIGQALTDALVARGEPCVFVDADDLHPVANKEKMRQGIPLTDEDRWPGRGSTRAPRGSPRSNRTAPGA